MMMSSSGHESTAISSHLCKALSAGMSAEGPLRLKNLAECNQCILLTETTLFPSTLWRGTNQSWIQHKQFSY